MTENISRIVYAALDADPPPSTEPVSVTTAHLMHVRADLDGARFDDVYPNVLAWQLTRDRRAP